jgi:hypothetical protein
VRLSGTESFSIFAIRLDIITLISCTTMIFDGTSFLSQQLPKTQLCKDMMLQMALGIVKL